MIYLTPYNPTTREAVADSADSGFSSLDEVVLLMGEPKARGPRWMTYPDGVAFSDFPFRLTNSSDAAYHAGN